ncbi:MAG TPA: YigZ family protein, partial [Hanamia sp.]|nr:YigZ family protein [Hanamia sp.]
MKENDYYFTIETTAVAEFKDRGSKFLAYSFPVKNINDFKKHLQNLKKEHPKAVHHCFAYRIGTDGNVFRTSDDGEPSGTAGKPILGQIDSKNLTDILIVVVRYFGGTLLGV